MICVHHTEQSLLPWLGSVFIVNGFRIIWKQAVMGRHVMIASSTFLLATAKHRQHMFSWFNGGRSGRLLHAGEQTCVKHPLRCALVSFSITNITEE